MKVLFLLLLLLFVSGCASKDRYFKTKDGKGPYIPRYLQFHAPIKQEPQKVEPQQQSAPETPKVDTTNTTQ
jgi:hypothetical protein